MNLSSDEFPLSAGDFLLLLKHVLSGSQEDVDLEGVVDVMLPVLVPVLVLVLLVLLESNI